MVLPAKPHMEVTQLVLPPEPYVGNGRNGATPQTILEGMPGFEP